MRWLLLILLVVSAASAAQTIPRAAEEHRRVYLSAYRQVWGLESPAWLAAQVEQESGWRDGQTSSANARGLCQFIEKTAAGLEGQYPGLSNMGRYSPRWCAFSQSIHMRDLFRDFLPGRTECNAMKWAGSAYNGGLVMLGRETKQCAAEPGCLTTEWDENVAPKNARAPVYWRENRGYVFRITQREAVWAAAGWGQTLCHR